MINQTARLQSSPTIKLSVILLTDETLEHNALHAIVRLVELQPTTTLYPIPSDIGKIVEIHQHCSLPKSTIVRCTYLASLTAHVAVSLACQLPTRLQGAYNGLPRTVRVSHEVVPLSTSPGQRSVESDLEACKRLARCPEYGWRLHAIALRITTKRDVSTLGYARQAHHWSLLCVSHRPRVTHRFTKTGQQNAANPRNRLIRSAM